MMLTPPAVRFVRCFDCVQSRMVNLWFRLNTQEQINNQPLATELTVQAQTTEEAMAEIRKCKNRWMTEETIEEIEKASHQLTDAKPSYYGVGQARG